MRATENTARRTKHFRATRDGRLATKSNAVRASHPNRIHKPESRFCLAAASCCSRQSALRLLGCSSFCNRRRVHARGIFASDHVQRFSVPQSGTDSEEAATPGLPATLARFGNRFSNLLGALTAKPSGSTGAGPVRLLQNRFSRSLAAQHSRLQ
jgi:hypothetical protein